MNKSYKSQQGFTIIEVVLVLAIAALIFLMIFVALPALQAGQRDTARKSDAGIVSSSVTNYTSAYRSPLKATTDQANLQKYVGKLDQYTAGADAVKVRGGGVETAIPADQEIWVRYASKCNGPDAAAGGPREATVRVKLENGTAYCVDAS